MWTVGTRLIAGLLLAIGSQPSLSVHPAKPITRRVAASGVAVEITSDARLDSAEGAVDSGAAALIRHANKEKSVHPPKPITRRVAARGVAVEITSDARLDSAEDAVDSGAAALIRHANKENVAPQAIPTGDTMDLCGWTCVDILEDGAPCTATWASGCQSDPPPGFTTWSTLYDLCPQACGPTPEFETASSTKGSFYDIGVPILIGITGCFICAFLVSQCKAADSKRDSKDQEDDVTARTSSLHHLVVPSLSEPCKDEELARRMRDSRVQDPDKSQSGQAQDMESQPEGSGASGLGRKGHPEKQSAMLGSKSLPVSFDAPRVTNLTTDARRMLKVSVAKAAIDERRVTSFVPWVEPVVEHTMEQSP